MRSLAGVAIAGVLVAGSALLAGCSVIENVVNSVGSGNIPEGLGAGQSVPADFPAEVPLIDGDVAFGLSLPGENGEGAWNVTINVTGPDAFETIKAQLTDAGFAYQGSSQGESGSGGAFTKDSFTVLVVVAAGNGSQWTANYTVTIGETTP